MSLSHEAYLFQPDVFARTVMPRVEALQTMRDGYNILRAEALRLYEASQLVRALADEHGGWDRDGIATAFPEREPAGSADAAFWVTLFLYGHITQLSDRRLGLNGYWEVLDRGLMRLGWGDARRRLLIEGRDFGDLARAWISAARQGREDGTVGAPLLWDHLSWSFQSGRVGWLGDGDVQDLLQYLMMDEAKLTLPQGSLTSSEMHGQPQGDDQIDAEQMREAFRLAIAMLTVAAQEQCGLCLIIAG